MGILTLEKAGDSYSPPGLGELTGKQSTYTTPTKRAMDKISLPAASIPAFVTENMPRGYGPMAPPASGVGPGTSIPHPGGTGAGNRGVFDPGSFVNAVGAGAQTFDVVVTGAAGSAKATGSGQNGSSGGGQGDLGLDPMKWGIGTLVVLGGVGWMLWRRK